MWRVHITINLPTSEFTLEETIYHDTELSSLICAIKRVHLDARSLVIALSFLNPANERQLYK